MDTIRRKMYLLKAETSEMLTRMLSAEKDAEVKVGAASGAEKSIRELSKKVAGKENDLDLAEDKLEAVESKIRKVEESIKRSLEDALVLKNLIAPKEADLKKTEEEGAKVNAALIEHASRGDVSDKGRRDLEHRCNHKEDKLVAMEKDIDLAKKTTIDAMEKYEETAKRANMREKALERAEIRAKKASDRVQELEQQMASLAKVMGVKVGAREASARREEGLKGKMIQLSRMVDEAEHRADQSEEEVAKLEILLEQMERNKKALRTKMDSL